MSDLNEQMLQADDGVKNPPRIKLGEQGYPGLKVIQKQILEESNKKLRMPYLIREIDEMKKDASISAALDFYRMMLGRVEWKVVPKVGATDLDKERAKFIESCMHDMNGQSWFSFIQSILSSIDYGFCVSEKVFKRRTKNNSKYDDGLVGWKYFPVRSQSTISGWIFSPDGRNLVGLQQSLANLQYAARYSSLMANGTDIEIPREKFMLFRTSPMNDNPEGRASLKSAWVAWRYKKAIEEQEMLGISRDLGGLLNISIPARYMNPDASAAEKGVYEEYKRVVRNVAQGEQSGIVSPSDYDPDTKQKMFNVELLTSQGGKSYDTNKIIERFTNQMLISLFADLLQMGNSSGGSFALSGNKKEIVEYAIEFRLREIQDVLNNDLIKQTFELNGWDTKSLPSFEFGDVQQLDLEVFSKAIQRICAVDAVERDREFFNSTRKALGLSPYQDDEEVNKDLLTGATSKAGQGMVEGLPSGTGSAVTSENTSDNNADNAA